MDSSVIGAPHSPGRLPRWARSPVVTEGAWPPHPPAAFSRSRTLGSIRSTTCFESASSFEMLTEFRTASSAQSALRFHRSASERM